MKHPDTELLIKYIAENSLLGVSRNMKNVLENVTLKKHLVLKNIKRETLDMGSVGVLMSGSGPTIFAFFEDMLKAQMCYDKMKKKYKEVFITRTI
jgi:4-diphosphocytidyl-2-C-methyl-D-erythritol kinase